MATEADRILDAVLDLDIVARSGGGVFSGNAQTALKEATEQD
ncbi:hypothetical protein ACFQZ4_05215 [Catellatospora coxensis]|nr:hypothetical protein [Catellatospora coxensis]